MLSCQATMMSDKERDTLSPALADVLAAYEDLFREPTELPPKK